MTTQELYHQVLNESITKESFLYQVRKDPRFKQWITPLTNYTDTVQILKNKGILTEGIVMSKLYSRYQIDPKEAEQYVIDNKEIIKNEFSEIAKMSHPDRKFTNWLDSILTSNINESIKQEKAKYADIDLVNPYELQKGIRIEYEDNYETALKKAIKNLQTNPTYYTDLKAGQKVKKDRSDLMITLSKKKDNILDKANAMTTVIKDKVKSNVSDDLGNKEKGTKKLKGVEILTQTPKRVKGIEVMEIPKKEQKPKVAKAKLIKEMVDDISQVISHTTGAQLLNKVANEWGEDSPLFDDLYKIIGPGNQILSGELYNRVAKTLKYYDVLDEYRPYLDVSINELSSTETPIDKDVKNKERALLQAQIRSAQTKLSQLKEIETSLVTITVDGKKHTMTKSEALALMDKIRLAMEKLNK